MLLVSLLGGLFLHRTIRHEGSEAAWHLAHAGGSGRGVLLMALAGTIHRLVLPPWQLSALVWLVVGFAWTSTVAMIVAAATGERGLRFEGSHVNKLVYVFYAMSAMTVFPAAFALIAGFFKAL